MNEYLLNEINEQTMGLQVYKIHDIDTDTLLIEFIDGTGIKIEKTSNPTDNFEIKYLPRRNK